MTTPKYKKTDLIELVKKYTGDYAAIEILEQEGTDDAVVVKIGGDYAVLAENVDRIRHGMIYQVNENDDYAFLSFSINDADDVLDDIADILIQAKAEVEALGKLKSNGEILDVVNAAITSKSLEPFVIVTKVNISRSGLVFNFTSNLEGLVNELTSWNEGRSRKAVVEDVDEGYSLYLEMDIVDFPKFICKFNELLVLTGEIPEIKSIVSSITMIKNDIPLALSMSGEFVDEHISVALQGELSKFVNPNGRTEVAGMFKDEVIIVNVISLDEHIVRDLKTVCQSSIDIPELPEGYTGVQAHIPKDGWELFTVALATVSE